MDCHKKTCKRIVIAGCRDFTDYKTAKEYIDFCISDILKEYEIIIVSGASRGADKLGERYAEENGFKLEKYPAEWGRYGKGAGPRRNQIMAEICDLVICFWDGESRGTKSMIECAEKCGKFVKIKRTV